MTTYGKIFRARRFLYEILEVAVLEVTKLDSNLLHNEFIFFNREVSSTKIENFPADLQEAINDSRDRKNLHGPFDTAEDAVKSMLED